MTTDFATAVSALAPVIMLAGFVEMIPYAKQARERGIEAVRTKMEPLEGEGTWRHMRRYSRGVLLPLVMTIAWLIMGSVLVGVEMQSLAYLAGQKPTISSSDRAEDIYRCIQMGMVLLVVTPLTYFIKMDSGIFKAQMAALADEEPERRSENAKPRPRSGSRGKRPRR